MEMKYLQLICIEGETGTSEAAAAMRDHIGPWFEDVVRRRVHIVGKPLDGPETAKTVRVRDGETHVSDGPFADTKEFIGGLDLLDCENLDEAIEVAAKHPVSWFHAIELRPFAEGLEIPATLRGEDLRHLLQEFVVDGADPVDPSALMAWRQAAQARGALLLGHALQHRDTATTVRVREGETLITDGPFLETKEFLGGVALLSCEQAQDALELASSFPLASGSAVEVRRFIDL